MEEYELLGELGSGGLSTVYVAAPLGTRRRVALKRIQLLSPDQARAWAFLGDLAAATPVHPAVLRPLASFVHAGEPWLVQRLMAGGSLRRHAGALSPAQAARVLVTVLLALDAAGRRGIAHGDLKPENILLGPRGAVLVGDFGMVAAHERARRCAVWGTRIATPAYMAPEQALGARATPAADLFAVGAIAYELLAGHPPLAQGEALEELVRQRAQEPAPALAAARPDLDPRLTAWVDGLMAPAPEDRPPGAAAARARLEEIVADAHGPRWREEANLPSAPPPAAGKEAPPARPSAQLLAELAVHSAASPAEGAGPPASPSAGSRWTPRRLPLAAWLVLGLVLVAGAIVGAVALQRSQDEPPLRTPTARAAAAVPLAASEYRRRGNAVCADQPALGDLFGAVRDPTQIRSVVLLALTSSLRPALAGLTALRPPPELLAAHRRALALSRSETDLLQRLADNIASGADPARATRAALPPLDRLEARANRVYSELGLTRCARAAQAPGAGP